MTFISPLTSASFSSVLCLLLLSPALCAAAPQGTPQSIRDYILANYPDVHKVMAQDFIQSASSDGLIASLADRILAKQIFLDLRRSKAEGRGALRFDIDRLVNGESAAAGNELGFMTLIDAAESSAEQEYNDSGPYADSMADASFMTGSIASDADLDYYSFSMPSTALAIASVLPRGGTPLVDPRLLIQTADGSFVSFNDDANGGLFPTICAILPAGEYRFAVDTFPGSQPGDYTLNILRVPEPVQPLTLGAVTNGSITNLFGELYEFTLAADSHVSMQFTGGPLDLRMTLLRSDNGLHFFVDDSSLGLDPAFDSELPAGDYFVLVDEFAGLTGNYTFVVDATPSSPAISVGVDVSGALAGAESFRLYRLDLAGPAALSLSTSAGAVDPIDDTIIDLFDQNLHPIASNDDNGASLFSHLDTFLPAGRYYVGVRGFGSAAGSFDLSSSSAPLPVAELAKFTNNVVGTAPGEEALVTVVIKTPNPIEIQLHDDGTHPDPRMTTVDATGHRVLLNERGPLGDSGEDSGFLEPGTYMVTVRSEGNAGAGNFGVEVRPPLWVDEVGPGICRGMGHHKEGDPVLVLVGPSEAPPMVLFPGLLEGFLLMTSINNGVLSMVTPVGGEITWVDIPDVTCTVQGLYFDFLGPVAFNGRWTDVINIVDGVIF